MTAAIVPGPIWWPRGDQLGELAHDALAGVRLALLAVERQQVAAQEDLAVEVRLQRAQHHVLAARQLGGDVVGELDLRPHPCSAARTSSDTRLPSARPSTAAIACFIAAPMSLARLRAAVATACVTIAVELLLGELRRQIGADQLRLGLLAAGEVLAPGVAVGARPPPAGACARDAAPPARHRRLPWRPSAARRARAAARRRARFSPARIAPCRSTLICSTIAIRRPGYAAAAMAPMHDLSRARSGVRAAQTPGRGGVATEHQRHVPVDQQAQLASDAGHQQQVVGARDQPRGQAAPADAERDRDRLVVAELGDDALGAVAKRPRRAAAAARRRRCGDEPALADRVLGGRRAGLARLARRRAPRRSRRSPTRRPPVAAGRRLARRSPHRPVDDARVPPRSSGSPSGRPPGWA